jgi:hypothetical protein
MSESAVSLIIWFILIMLGLTGWIVNLVKLFHLDAFGGEAIVRTIGVVVPPIGAILGYF